MIGQRPRIAHVLPTLQLGGLELVATRVVNHLSPDLEQLIVCPGIDGPLRAQFSARVGVVALGRRRGFGNLQGMVAVFRRFRPTVVHARNWSCIDAVPAARLAGVGVVLQGEHGRHAADPMGRQRSRRLVRKVLSPMVTRFVAVSRDLVRWLIEDVGVSARKVVHLPNGVDTHRFSPGERELARRAIGISEGGMAIGIVGRLEPIKEHDILIRAYAELARTHDACLVIAGDGPCRAAIERQVSASGLGHRIHVMGERGDVTSVLRALDVFVLCSRGEGMSNAILEAMACGRPVVATRVGGNAELIEDGRSGTLVEPGDASALAGAIARYLDDPPLARRHGAEGRRRIEQEFSLERMLDGYRALYDHHLTGNLAGMRR